MIEELVNHVFMRIGHVWKIGDSFFTPEPDDVRKVLDEAAGRLYDSPVGTQFQTGGLIIEKTADGFDTYTFTGNFN